MSPTGADRPFVAMPHLDMSGRSGIAETSRSSVERLICRARDRRHSADPVTERPRRAAGSGTRRPIRRAGARGLGRGWPRVLGLHRLVQVSLDRESDRLGDRPLLGVSHRLDLVEKLRRESYSEVPSELGQ